MFLGDGIHAPFTGILTLSLGSKDRRQGEGWWEVKASMHLAGPEVPGSIAFSLMLMLLE